MNVPRSVPLKVAALLLLTALMASAQPSNVLLIIADDLGVDKFSADRPAWGQRATDAAKHHGTKSSGVLFTRAYAQPVCSPTRCCMLTGRNAFRTGIGVQLEAPLARSCRPPNHVARGVCGECGPRLLAGDVWQMAPECGCRDE